MSRETIIKEAIDDLKHGIEVGNIILQMPEDEHIISILIQTLEKQIPVNLILRNSGVCECPNCKTIYSYIEYYRS